MQSRAIVLHTAGTTYAHQQPRYIRRETQWKAKNEKIIGKENGQSLWVHLKTLCISLCVPHACSLTAESRKQYRLILIFGRVVLSIPLRGINFWSYEGDRNHPPFEHRIGDQVRQKVSTTLTKLTEKVILRSVPHHSFDVPHTHTYTYTYMDTFILRST